MDTRSTRVIRSIVPADGTRKRTKAGITPGAYAVRLGGCRRATEASPLVRTHHASDPLVSGWVPRIEVDSFDLPLLEVRQVLRGNAQRIAFLDCQHRAFGMRAPSRVGRRIQENRAG
jgi:hypothetical protein